MEKNEAVVKVGPELMTKTDKEVFLWNMHESIILIDNCFTDVLKQKGRWFPQNSVSSHRSPMAK